ncbi:MAG: hypothetical protein ACLP01_20320 [Solirubrobacteraceae bacterium]
MSIIAGRIVAFAAAGLLALAGVAVAAPSGQYGGPTSQKVGGSPLRITLTVAGGALAKVSVDAVVEQGGAACSLNGAGGSTFDFSRGTVRIDRQGKFDGTLKDPNNESVTISGRFKGHTAAGSFEIETPSVGQGTATCSSGRVTFTANAAGGQAKNAKYSGTVGPGYPINFRVSANDNAVEDLAVAIEATCQPGAGSIAPVYDFKTLRITSGTFSGSVFAQHGSTVSDLVRISGTFFGRVAVGAVTDLSHITSLPDCTNSEPFTATAM